MKKLVLILFVFLTALSAEATHMMGGEITYKYISSLKYEVTLVWYRDCRGVALTNAGIINVKCSTGGSLNDTLSLISIADILPFCSTDTSKCSPSNSSLGWGEGVEKHVYRDTIDFNLSPLSSLASCTGKIIFSASINARSSFITTGSSNTTLYIDAELDLANYPNNSSAVISAPALGYLCCNQPFYYTFNAIDTLDYDSLTYSFISPRSAANTTTSYSYPYSYTKPFKAYDPRPGGGTPLPNYTPPIGIFLDAATGELIFTPTNCSQVTVAVVQITEWRKDSTGTPKIIGKTLRDMQFIVQSCPNNNPPTISGPFNYLVCEEDQLCFNISTNDVTFSSPGTTPPPPDSTKLTWDGRIVGASFNILNDTALHQKGRFCWTPPVGSVKNIPYSFVATVRDNACPINAVTVRSFQITVKKRAFATPFISKILPDFYGIQTLIDSATFKGTASYSWSIFDSINKQVTDTNSVKFISTNTSLSNSHTDTVRLNRNGLFVIKSTISNPPNNCPTTYYDTITVDSVLQTLISFPKDTLVCAGTSAVLSTTTVFSQGTPNYQWYKDDTTLLAGDTFSTLTVTDIPRLANTTYTVQVTDSSGKINRDKIRIQSKDNFDNSFDATYFACFGDSIVLQLDSLYTNRLWNDGANDSIRTYYQSASLWVAYQDSFGCAYIDTLDVIIHALPQPILSDSSTCGSSITLSAGKFVAYQWSAGVGFKSETYTATTSDVYNVTVTDSNGCKNSDSATINIWNATLVDLGNDSIQCGSLLLTNNIISSQLWSTGDTIASILVSYSGVYSVFTTDSNGCQSFDTITVTIHSLPNPVLVDSNTCGNSMNITSGNFSSYAWSSGQTTETIRVSTSNAYSVLVTDSNGCQNSDTANIVIWNAPLVELGNDSSQCSGTILLTNTIYGSQLWSTGDTSKSIVVSTSGKYSIVTTDTNNCQSFDTISIDIYSYPIQTWPDTIFFCSDTGAVISSKPFAHYVWNTGDTTQSIHINSNGNYSLYFQDLQGCDNIDSVYIIIHNLPTVYLGQDTTFCGTTITLDAGNQSHYNWNDGSSNQQLVVTATGEYEVTVTDSNSCSSSDSIIVTVNSPPSLNLGNDTAFCGDSLLLALAPGNSFSWSTGDTLNFTSINISGDYWVQISDSNGCSATDTVNITLLTNTNVPVLTKNGLVITSNLGGTHHWFMDENLINGKSDSFITISSIGSYTAVSIDSNGCISDTSNSIIRTAGIDKLSNSTIKIYPNPTNGQVTIDATGLGNINSVKLYDNLGKLVEYTQITNGSIINVAWEARSGVLWVVVETVKGVYRSEVMSVR